MLNLKLRSVLPPELEQRIFHISAESNLAMISTHVLVASRIKEWIEPLRFRSLVFKNQDFSSQIQLIESKSVQFLAKHVRFCCLDTEDRILSTMAAQAFLGVLPCFTSLYGLALWSYWPKEMDGTLPVDLSYFRELRILSLCWRTMVAPSAFSAAGSNINITHISWEFVDLHILDLLIRQSQLPHLTHIRVLAWETQDTDRAIDNLFRARVSWFLSNEFQEIHALIFHVVDLEGSEDWILETFPELVDPRVVLIEDYHGGLPDLEEWHRTATRDNDAWARAENLMRDRRQYLQPTQC
ncbi:hypothetical protein DL96DRAFT_1824725 [Flagelloscypha sp. PMI_526]|nr:hypothetical protein DL96DRAFT_1824725 [Flagelloscypha sp. PMI_526]